MQLTIEIPNKNIAEKVLWFLEHLKNDGVKIIQNNLDNNELSSIKTALKEVELIEDGSLKHTETLDELIEKLENDNTNNSNFFKKYKKTYKKIS